MEKLKRTEKRRPNKQGGVNRAMLRHRRYEEAAEIADNKLLTHQIDESSPALFSVIFEPELIMETQVVFDSTLNRDVFHEERKADIAKKRGDIINDLLENPKNYTVTKSNLNFIKRHFGRIIRFARTLKNKGKLHPEIEDILEV